MRALYSGTQLASGCVLACRQRCVHTPYGLHVIVSRHAASSDARSVGAAGLAPAGSSEPAVQAPAAAAVDSGSVRASRDTFASLISSSLPAEELEPGLYIVPTPLGGCICLDVRARTHACMHARTYIRTHAHTHTRLHARMHAPMHARTHARMHAHTHARTHARTHTHTPLQACMEECAIVQRTLSPLTCCRQPRGHHTPGAARPALLLMRTSGGHAVRWGFTIRHSRLLAVSTSLLGA